MRSLVKRLGMGLPNNLLPQFPAITGSLIDRREHVKPSISREGFVSVTRFSTRIRRSLNKSNDRMRVTRIVFSSTVANPAQLYDSRQHVNP